MIIIASFWKGHLTQYEVLAIKSWLKHGYVFHLYTYDAVDNVPDGIVMCDARDIMPETMLQDFKFIANFADCFRYVMIYKTGKVWTDLDVFCLNPVDLLDEYIFVTERTIKEGAFKSKEPEKLVISFMKGPQGSLMFYKMHLECIRLNQNFNIKYQSNLGLAADKHPGGRLLVEKHIKPEMIKPYNFAFPIDWWDYRKCFKSLDGWKCSRGWLDTINVDNILTNGKLLIIHNGWIKHHNIDKANPVPGSLYHKLYLAFN
jgi:hypothetical protein